ncbi:hypothetical protein RRG08_059784 [Elysia crispata]|uniref:Uncharacterized protein n=1 Tax=Elysia crispata TaxID=231223 RepID=A0AAE1BDJ5_9GAST|nr:hypothetical protein RRG08_059784 [Elysia crispata]
MVTSYIVTDPIPGDLCSYSKHSRPDDSRVWNHRSLSIKSQKGDCIYVYRLKNVFCLHLERNCITLPEARRSSSHPVKSLLFQSVAPLALLHPVLPPANIDSKLYMNISTYSAPRPDSPEYRTSSADIDSIR